MSERISREELVKIYNVEITFFDSLEEAGLVSPVTENEIKYLLYDELPAFERFTNWYYDLEVNLPGLEIINHLLRKLEKLQAENRTLHYNQVKWTEE
ncbi:MerR HTH family regulatory protein [Kaistella treverensis]|uniref:MerR HTH family regulatory protein n=1 Tax=Kaistella treverensis TaxID=631455 RepID=A0A1I3NVV7_9FLAO|nr:chaperone modulator CbpM [Kaistella treverensis]SFJ13359.1 MerR HTH family regulatory protein [Kaistella treverensis]